mmetsp:Transcript_1124/g.2609  ORF Transcript_1124/g.2609 Transcript_1124/m.2609 type:complete len:174 (+) Transcript_1124:389-910(+)
MSGEQEPAARPPAAMMRMVGRGAQLKLVNGSTRTGFVYAVDPETACVLLLVKDPQHDAWSVSAAMPGSIASFSEEDLGGAEAFAAAMSACPLVSDGGGGAPSFSPEELEERRRRLEELLRLHRLDVAPCEGGALAVLGGVVRVEAPYTADSCRSTNDMVLQQIAVLIAKLDQV